MCIAAFAFGIPGEFRLVFAANRDELHTRATAAADWWPGEPAVLGGRDLVAGGSWLAIDRRGRLGAVTNLPQDVPRRYPRSRGSLVREFLTADRSAAVFAAEFTAHGAEFGPCNLLLWDGEEFHYAATGSEPVRLAPGVHAVGNAPLGADWPRAHRAEAGLRACLTAAEPAAALLELLANGRAEPESADAALARRRTEIFIRGDRYGTRSSTVVLISADGRARFIERSFAADGRPSGTREHAFTID